MGVTEAFTGRADVFLWRTDVVPARIDVIAGNPDGPPVRIDGTPRRADELIAGKMVRREGFVGLSARGRALRWLVGTWGTFRTGDTESVGQLNTSFYTMNCT
jgi:hypothetical protein